jgi:anti-sigma regulatory factor (Ser/Thr protein kinase)
MSSSTRETGSHVHDGGLYGSDDEFLELLLPFVEQGLAQGEPVITGYDDRKATLLKGALAAPDGVTFISDASLYATPARAIHTYRQLFQHHVENGATRIRIAGDVPHSGNGGNFEGWDRYESGVNVVWNDVPLLSFCLYDTRITPDHVLDVVTRTHRHLVTPEHGRQVSARYEDVGAFRGEPVPPDPLEATAPSIELIDPDPTDARRLLRTLAGDTLDAATLDALAIGITEGVANAHRHGARPVTVKMWKTHPAIVVTVHDSGPGPADPLAGLRPAPGTDGGTGLGLWVTHQLCDDVALVTTPDGFTVRLRATTRS